MGQVSEECGPLGSSVVTVEGAGGVGGRVEGVSTDLHDGFDPQFIMRSPCNTSVRISRSTQVAGKTTP